MIKIIAYSLMTFISPFDGSIEAHVHVFKEGTYTDEECRQSLDDIWAELAPVTILEAGCFSREIDVPDGSQKPALFPGNTEAGSVE